MALVVDEVMQAEDEQGKELAAYVLLRRIMQQIHALRGVMDGQGEGLGGMDRWQEYRIQHEFH